MIAAFDNPLLSGLLGDEEMATLLGVEAELAAMLQFEKALADAEAALGIVPAAAASAIGRVLDNFRPEMQALRDGVGARRRHGAGTRAADQADAVGQPHSEHVHFGATSQDVIDTAMVLRVSACIDLLEGRLCGFGGHPRRSRAIGLAVGPLMGRTRMQAAMPISVADRVESWREPFCDTSNGFNRCETQFSSSSSAGPRDAGEIGGRAPPSGPLLPGRWDSATRRNGTASATASLSWPIGYLL